jgi:hypothetical protein
MVEFKGGWQDMTGATFSDLITIDLFQARNHPHSSFRGHAIHVFANVDDPFLHHDNQKQPMRTFASTL